MIFHIVSKHTQQIKTTHTVEVEFGQRLCGLQQGGVSPTSITLTRRELIFLLNPDHREYAITSVLTAMRDAK